MNKDKAQITFWVTQELREQMGDLAGRLDVSLTGFLKLAIALYMVAAEEKEKGNRLAIVDSEGRVVTRIVGI